MNAYDRGMQAGRAEAAAPRDAEGVALAASTDWACYGEGPDWGRQAHRAQWAMGYQRGAGLLQSGPALVGIDGQAHGEAAEGCFWAHAADVSLWRWNGWAVPMFTRAEVDRIAAQCRAFNAALSPDEVADCGALVLTWDGDVLVSFDPHYPDEEPTREEPGALPDGTPVWGVGDGWCWSEVEMVGIPADALAVLA